MADGLRKIRPVILNAKRRKTKPADMSQAEWDSYADARRRSAEAAKRPHIFGRAHELMRQHEMRLRRKRGK